MPTIAEARVSFFMGMKPIPQATVIPLTGEELKELVALAGSREGEASMRAHARMALLAIYGPGYGRRKLHGSGQEPAR